MRFNFDSIPVTCSPFKKGQLEEQQRVGHAYKHWVSAKRKIILKKPRQILLEKNSQDKTFKNFLTDKICSVIPSQIKRFFELREYFRKISHKTFKKSKDPILAKVANEICGENFIQKCLKKQQQQEEESQPQSQQIEKNVQSVQIKLQQQEEEQESENKNISYPHQSHSYHYHEMDILFESFFMDISNNNKLTNQKELEKHNNQQNQEGKTEQREQFQLQFRNHDTHNNHEKYVHEQGINTQKSKSGQREIVLCSSIWQNQWDIEKEFIQCMTELTQQSSSQNLEAIFNFGEQLKQLQPLVKISLAEVVNKYLEDNEIISSQSVNQRLSKIIPEQHICVICWKYFQNGCQLGGHISKKHPGCSMEFKMKSVNKQLRSIQKMRKNYFLYIESIERNK